MAKITIESDQRIQSINIVFAEDGAGDVSVIQTDNSNPRSHPIYPTPESDELPEIETSDFEEMDQLPEHGEDLPKDNRKTVGESLEGVDFEVPEMSKSASPSAIEVPDVEDRPQKVDDGMGMEL